MSLTKPTYAVDNIQSLSDTPNETEGLTSDQLKAKFDETGADSKTWQIAHCDEVDALFTYASQAEAQAGTDNTKLITALRVKEAIDYNYRKDGWTAVTDSWAYASATTITVPSGAASLYRKGDKLKLTQSGSVKYFYIVNVADTVLTITGGSDYTLANETISAIYYSHELSPIGFPLYFNWSPTTSGITKGTGGTLTTRFSINGNILNFYINFIFGTGSAISGRNTFTTPVANVNSGYASVYIFDVGATVFMGLCEISPNQIAVDAALSNGTYVSYATFSSTVPMTWTTSDTYSASGWYFI